MEPTNLTNNVEEFRTLSEAELNNAGLKSTAKIAATLHEVLSKKITVSASGTPGTHVFTTDNEDKILELFATLLREHGLYKSKSATFKELQKVFQTLVNSVNSTTITDIKKFEKNVEIINSLVERMNQEIAPLIEATRIPIVETLQKFMAFFKSLDCIKKSPKGIFSSGKSYIGVVMKKDSILNGSGHMTLAFTEKSKIEYSNYIGQYCNVYVSSKEVCYTDKEGKKYAYHIVKIMFADTTEFIGHSSIHNVGDEWGTEYRINGKHQSDNPHPENLTWDDSFTSLVLPFIGSKPLVTLDLDGTLVKCGDKYYDGMLTDASLLVQDNITFFGSLVQELGIPFHVLTSRRGITNQGKNLQSKLETAIIALFPSCKGISWGNKLSHTADTAEGNMKRAYLKAVDKSTRLAKLFPDHLHIDDEQIVIETIGIGSIVYDGKDLTTYISDIVLTKCSHKAVALVGPVGVGKSTLVGLLFGDNTTFIAVPQVGTDIDNETQTIVMVAGPDYADKGPNFYHKEFEDKYANRNTLYIYDSTGVGRKFPFPTFQLNQEITATMFLGCYISLLNRTGHPNLNGICKVDLLSTLPNSQIWNTNHMSLTDFINYIWNVYNGSHVDITKAMSYSGQNFKFFTKGNSFVLFCSYREGQQQWDTPWGIQNRKTVLVLHQCETKWQMLKAGMDAGSEMKPLQYSEEGDKYQKNLSPLLEQIRGYLFNGKQLPSKTCLIGKVDGALIQVTVVNTDSKKGFDMTMADDNTFVRIFAKGTYKLSEGKSYMILSSNGTLNIPIHMWDYWITALAPLLGVSDELLQELMKKPATQDFLENYGFNEIEINTPVLRAWSHMVAAFQRKISEFTSNLEANNETLRSSNYTIQIEGICKNRSTCTGELHKELALSYPMSCIRVLGIKCGEVYIPSIEIEDILDKLCLIHPLFWRENNPVNILKMLAAIQRLSTDPLYTTTHFINEFPPDNKIVTNVKDIFIDHEGFILLVKSVSKWVYCKLKTLLYYIFHKLSERNIKQVIQLSCSLELPHFPIAKIIQEHYKLLSKIDGKKMDADITTIMLKSSPIEPVDDSNKTKIGQYKAFSTILSSGKISKLRMFLWHNGTKEMYMKVYDFIWSLFGASYVLDMYNKLTTDDKLSDDNTDKLRKINGSMKTLLDLVFEEFTDDIFCKFCSHLLFLQNDLPKPVQASHMAPEHE